MESIWSEEVNLKKRNTELNRDLAQVVVVGAGMAGLLTAYHLKQEGFDVVVLEAKSIASGQTKNTTAKITALHGLRYAQLFSKLGEEQARQYYEANDRAIRQYSELIKDKNIACHFEEKPAYVYTRDDLPGIEEELRVMERLKIPGSFTKETKLPFRVEGAVCMQAQAQFHPLKFIEKIAESLDIYEDTRVVSIEDNLVYTNKGKMKAEWIIMAAHFPFINIPGYYFSRMHQERSYVIALDQVADLEGMYIGTSDDDYSLRNYNGNLLFGGGQHRTGEEMKNNRYQLLRDAAHEYYPESIERYHWSAQDCMTLDSVPYIGKFSSGTPRLLVATGFEKWGMAASMAAAHILTDRIAGRENPYQDLFTPQRFKISAVTKSLLTDTVKAVEGLSKEFLTLPRKVIEGIGYGQAKVIMYEGKKIGAYRDEEGEFYFVSTKCTHLGCQLEWNASELSWDCPCHGSRFSYTGNLLDNPAMKGVTYES